MIKLLMHILPSGQYYYNQKDQVTTIFAQWAICITITPNDHVTNIFSPTGQYYYYIINMVNMVNADASFL